MVQMSIAEARRAGLLGDVTATGKPRKKKNRKQAPRANGETRCVACGEIFTTDAAEGRHMETEKHYRFETPDLTRKQNARRSSESPSETITDRAAPGSAGKHDEGSPEPV